VTVSASVPTTGFYDRVQVASPVSIALSPSPAAPHFAICPQPNRPHFFLYELLAAWQPWHFIGRRPYGNPYIYLWSA
jgi:hypothetical protein